MIEAWTERSRTMTSLRPARAEMAPRLVCMPVEKVRASSLPMNWASFFSSSTCREYVPFRKREPQVDAPYCWTAATAAALIFGSSKSPR